MMTDLYMYCDTNNFTVKAPIRRFTYAETYKLWHILFCNGDDLFVHDQNIVKLSICDFDKDCDSVALVINGLVKFIKDVES